VSPCTVDYDPKVPKERRFAAYLVRTDIRGDGLKVKDVILKQCNVRDDDLGETVRTRVLGAGSDLHAVNARYHNKCHIAFFSHSKSGKSKQPPEDHAFVSLCESMGQDRDRIWNSVDMKQVYDSYGGSMCSKSLFSKVHEYFGDSVAVLSSRGLANLMVFGTETGKMMHLVKSDEDDLGIAIDKIASQIRLDALAYKQKRTTYNLNIDRDLAREPISETLMTLLKMISAKFHDSPSALLIGNMVTSMVNSQPYMTFGLH
jgi:hypothetical protein